MVAVATLAFGFVVHAIARRDRQVVDRGRASAAASRASPTTGSSCRRTWRGWIAPTSYIGLIAVALLVTLVRGWVRLVLLVPTLYLAAFVWENVMLAKPEPTRYIVLGLILIALMILRPNGLLGERRVEIV